MIREDPELLCQLAALPGSTVEPFWPVGVTKRFPTQPQPEDSADGQVTYAISTGMPQRVTVKATQGDDATVVVKVVQGTVWMSITPAFTWEAIMEPGEVDELIHVLELAREEAQKIVVAVRGKRVALRKTAGVRAITKGAC